MERFDIEEETITVLQANSVDNPQCIKFRCDDCRRYAIGFHFLDRYAANMNIADLHCPGCGANYEKLPPCYYFDLIIQNEKGDTEQILAIGCTLNSVMGMTVNEFMKLGEEYGFELLFRYVALYFKRNRLIIRRNNGKVVSMRLPKGNNMNFKTFLSLQADFNMLDITASCEDSLFDAFDGF